MIHRTEFYDKDTNEIEYTYYWYDQKFIKHEFDSCFEAFEALDKYYLDLVAHMLEEELNYELEFGED